MNAVKRQDAVAVHCQNVSMKIRKKMILHKVNFAIEANLLSLATAGSLAECVRYRIPAAISSGKKACPAMESGSAFPIFCFTDDRSKFVVLCVKTHRPNSSPAR